MKNPDFYWEAQEAVKKLLVKSKLHCGAFFRIKFIKHGKNNINNCSGSHCGWVCFLDVERR